MTHMPHEPKNYTFFQSASNDAFEKARALRKNGTKAEDILWQAVRNRKIGGLKFRRQHPFEEFILDFYCNEKNLVLEIDGDYHLSSEQKEYDENRAGFLEQHGLKVLRITNEEVEKNLAGVLARIIERTK
jgi:very-short-patch-repair endonuclease